MSQLKRIFSGNINPEAETMVLLHGWAMNSSVWQAVLPSLETRFRVCCIDLPGHGENVHVPMGDIDDVVDQLIEALPENAHLLAWSLSGLLTLALLKEIETRSTTKNTPDIKSVTIVGMSPKFIQSEDWKNAVPKSQLETLYTNLNNNLEKTIASFIYLQFLNVKDTQSIQKELIDNVLEKRPDITSLNSGLEILSQQDLREATINPIIPVHWILGAKDKLVPQAVVKDIEVLFPRHTVTLLGKSAHIPFVTHPEVFLKVLLEFIDS